jgi:Fe-S cluster assembly protein SufD
MTTMSADAGTMSDKRLAGTGFGTEVIAGISELTGAPSWVRVRRESALATFDATPMPSTRDEHWRFTSLRGFSFDSAASWTAPVDVDASQLGGIATADSAIRFMSVNGGMVDTGAASSELPTGVIACSLADAVRDHEQLLTTYLGRAVPTTDSVNDKFVSLNDAAWSTGVFLFVPRGVTLDTPVEYVVAHATEDATIQPRIVVVLEAGARATFVEDLVSVHGATRAFSNAVVELLVGRGAQLTYVTSQNYATSVDHFATHRVLAEQDAQVDWVAVGLGGGRGKVRMEARLLGPGAHVKLTGAYAADGRQLIDYDTHQYHEAPNAMSDLSFKGVLDGSARSVWRGMIAVLPGAQGTDAYQENRNLLLAPTAHADSIPGLQIEANEVRCTHGATLSKVDPEQLFYLMARGVHRPEAVRTIVRGFFAPQLDRIPDDELRERVAQQLFARLDAMSGV